MSSGFVCTCQEPTAAKRKHWVVLVRHGNYSYFHSSRGSFEDSDYSEVACLKCQSRWRTKAKYAVTLYFSSTLEQGIGGVCCPQYKK